MIKVTLSESVLIVLDGFKRSGLFRRETLEKIFLMKFCL